MDEDPVKKQNAARRQAGFEAQPIQLKLTQKRNVQQEPVAVYEEAKACIVPDSKASKQNYKFEQREPHANNAIAAADNSMVNRCDVVLFPHIAGRCGPNVMCYHPGFN
jgi:hypothetical protein